MPEITFDLNASDLQPEPEVVTVGGPLIPEIVDEKEVLPALPSYSTHEVAKRLLQYDQEIALMEKEARAITIIQDEATNLQAAEKGQRAKKLYKKLEELRQHFVRPHLDYNQTVNDFFKRYTARLKAIDESLGRLESAYARFKENARRIEEAKAKQAAKEQEEALAKEAQEAATKGIEYVPIKVTAPVIPPKSTVTHTAYGSSSQREKWKCTIIDAAKVPREYCVPVQKLLNDAVKGGVRTIEGCKIEEDMSTVRRV